MTHPRTAGFDAVRPLLKPHLGLDRMTDGVAQVLDAFADAAGVPRVSAPAPIAPAAPVDPDDPLTERAALELISHESIVLEWYRDSVGVGTWGIGVTNRSGHSVDRYKDAPQTVQRCLEVYVWLLRAKYIPDVVAEFAGHPLAEAQFAAALSFHYNTGAIRKAGWVDLWLAGDLAGARTRIMDWDNPPEVRERRERERDLFFDGKWSGDGKATIWPVKKPGYRPDWKNGQRVDIRADLAAAMGGVK